MLAIILLCVLDEPIEERGAIPPGAIRIVRNQIVDVKGLARKKHVENTKPGHGSNHAVELQISDLIPLFLLLEDTGREIDCLDVRTQLSHHSTAPADLLWRSRQRDLP